MATEVLLVAIAASAVFLIALKLSSRWTAAATSFIAVPIILTGEFYFPGCTELPGITLALVAMAASVFGRPALAGSCMGLLVFTKLIFVPIALLGVSCFFLTDRRFSHFIFIVLGASASVALIVLVLFIRSELLPFVEMIRLNIAYSQGALIGSKKGLVSLATHIKIIGGWNNLFAQIVPLLLGIMLALITLSKQLKCNHIQIAISAACILTLAGSLAVLSMTGLWDHHRQILYITAILVILSLMRLLDASAKIARLHTLGLIFLIGFLIGHLSLSSYVTAIRNFRGSYAELAQVSPETRRLLAIGSSGIYARFGINDDMGHAVGLGNWKLACPRFHQFPFEPAALLDKVFECASTAPTLIISAHIVPQGPSWMWMPQVDWTAWNEFVAKVEHLTKSYSCDASSGLRVCTRAAAK